LKRDKTPREITAQVLDYASWVKGLPRDVIVEIADRYLRNKGSLEQIFAQRFGTELPETLNQRHRMLIVGSQIDPSSERIITYLSETYGVAINSVTFQFFRTEDGRELLARVFLLEPSAVDERASTLAPSKRRQNLSRDELRDLAAANGVGELYERILNALDGKFDSVRTTRSSLAFYGRLNGSENAIFSLIPGASNPEDGLHFQVYVPRLAAYLGISVADVGAFLPARREPWAYYPSAPTDMTGFAGFFHDNHEIDRFAGGLVKRSA
jgi:hypothetical protein